VSLTQLACLPLDTQLELVNGGIAKAKARESKGSVPKRSTGPTALFLKATAVTISVEPDIMHLDNEFIDKPNPLLPPSLTNQNSLVDSKHVHLIP
jgi:hypothetical protein